MISRLGEFLKKHDLQHKTIIVGFSGGFDSMCLLDMLSKIKEIPEFFELTVIAAHFNHNWRGEESLREQEVCRLFSSSKGFEFYTKEASKGLKKTENDARIARYEFFEEAMEEFDADAVFTAHNKDDNAETILYRVIKGTGLVGLKGISEKRQYFYRPLLKVSRSQIVEYCTKNNLQPNNDSSNLNIAYKRNYLRLNIIPALQKINENVKEALNTLAQVASSEDEIINEYLSQLKPMVFEEDKIIASEYKKLSQPVKKRLLHEYIQTMGLDYDYKKICEVYDFVEQNITQRNGSTMSLSASRWLYADEKVVEPIPRNKYVENVTTSLVIKGEGEYQIGNRVLVIKKYEEKDLFVFPEATSNFAYVDLSEVKFPLEVRTRKEGDLISPFGMSGTMKLKKYLNSKGVARHNRDKILLLAKEGEILWATGVGLSSKIAVKTAPTHVLEIV